MSSLLRHNSAVVPEQDASGVSGKNNNFAIMPFMIFALAGNAALLEFCRRGLNLAYIGDHLGAIFTFLTVLAMCAAILQNKSPGGQRASLKKSLQEYIIDHAAFYITNRCILSCPGCFRIGCNEAEVSEIPLEEAKKIIDSLMQQGFKSLTFTGGDPLLVSNIVEILAYAHEQGLVVGVQSSGVTLDENLIDRLEPFVDGLCLSLEGSSEEIHTSIRGPNSAGQYRNIIRLLPKLINRRFVLSIASVATKANREDLPVFGCQLAENRVRNWTINQFCPEGKGADPDISGKYFINDAEFNDICSSLSAQDFAQQVELRFIQTDPASRSGIIFIDQAGDILISKDREYIKVGNVLEGQNIAYMLEASGIFDLQSYLARKKTMPNQPIGHPGKRRGFSFMVLLLVISGLALAIAGGFWLAQNGQAIVQWLQQVTVTIGDSHFWNSHNYLTLGIVPAAMALNHNPRPTMPSLLSQEDDLSYWVIDDGVRNQLKGLLRHGNEKAIKAAGIIKSPSAAKILMTLFCRRSRMCKYPELARIRSAAADALGKIGESTAAEPLLECVATGEKSVRKSAANALGEIGGSIVVDRLIKLLDSTDKDVRIAAARALGNIGDPAAVDGLIGCLSDPNENVRYAAAEASGKIGDSRAVEPLVNCLSDSSRDVHFAVVSALGAIGDPNAVGPLTNHLGVRNYTGCSVAADVLVKMGGATTIDSLIKCLDNSDSNVRSDAAKALGEMGDPRAVKPLIKCLGDDDPFVRSVAAESLGKIGDPLAVEPLADCLRDRLENVRDSAAGALVKIGGSAVVELLINNYVSDPDILICSVSIYVLGKIGGSAAVETLINCLDSPKTGVCFAAARALGYTRDPLAVEPLIKCLDKDDIHARTAAVEALGEIGDSRAVEAISKCINNNDRIISSCAARALGKIGGLKAATSLIKCLNHSDSNVRSETAKSLGKLGDPRAVKPLIKCLKDDTSFVRSAAADALGEIGDPRAVKPLTKCLSDKNDGVHYHAVAALGKIGDPKSAEVLVKCAGNAEWNVHNAAMDALAGLDDVRAIKSSRTHGYYDDAEQAMDSFRKAHSDCDIGKIPVLPKNSGSLLSRYRLTSDEAMELKDVIDGFSLEGLTEILNRLDRLILHPDF
ncbi:MAG: HEAT repeat domain-containing protein, partial [Candidatus Omnitrophica bacterium]|nr:HEAT repeat domain-containing protein [Candidatus Omnitrophota bacterium]